MRSDGEGTPRRITANDYRENEPEWAPDGSRIVFESERGIMTIKPDGTGLRRLTAGRADTVPIWSPDSARIVFTRNSSQGYAHLFGIRRDGEDLIQLTHGQASDGEAEWAPDGSQLVFVRSEPSDDGRSYCAYISTIDLEGLRVQKLTDCRPHGGYASYHPVWSPDGHRIGVVLTHVPAAGLRPRDDVFSMAPDGSDRRNLTRELEEDVNYFGLDW